MKNAVIDGEFVCRDSEGRSIFNELLFRCGCPIFYAFDLLYLNGRDLRQRPLIERKEKLRALVEKSGLPDDRRVLSSFPRPNNRSRGACRGRFARRQVVLG